MQTDVPMPKSPDLFDPLLGFRSATDVRRGGPRGDELARYDERATRKAWETFVTNGQEAAPCSRALVRHVIERSWQRSVEVGVDARGRGSPESAAPELMHELRERNRGLLSATRPTFQRISEILGDTATMVVITDHTGVILEVGGDPATIEAGHDIRLEVGASWCETVTGTNGIGTALVTGQPIYVHAAEHFCEGVKAWTCVGAPIRSPIDGSIVGIVDFSGPEDIFHRHNVALGIVAANHIKLALAEQARIERTRLLEACLAKVQGFAGGDGLVLLDSFGRIIHLSETAPMRWRSLDQSVELKVGRQIIDFGSDGVRGDIASRLPEALRGQSLEPLIVDGAVSGAVLVLGSRPRTPVPIGRTVVAPAATAVDAVVAARQAIVGRSEPLLDAIERAERAALGKSAILLEGETGVGKELFARLIHAAGMQTGKEPFVAFNCGAVSKDLIGGELFGHAAGAFTGATRDGRPGRFETAQGGVLSLDEIGEMPLDLQPYLLRVLEERMVYRLGDSKPRQVDVHLVASTNRNLRQDVAEGRFRKDLYFRISAVKITIPPLRDRPGDVELLIDYFNRQISSTYGMEPLRFRDSVTDLLQTYNWPGNVRELRNLVENLALMSTTRIVGVEDFPEDFIADLKPRHEAPRPQQGRGAAAASLQFGASAGHDEIARLDETERRVIQRAIAASGGNMSVAAEKLGVSRSTLYRKLQHYKAEN
jgi:transcriptional regulator of acetoin/glycerol metabolism